MMIKDYFPSKEQYDLYVEIRISKAWVKSNKFLTELAADLISVVDEMIEWYDDNMYDIGTFDSRNDYLMQIHEIQKLTDYYQSIAKSMWEEVE